MRSVARIVVFVAAIVFVAGPNFGCGRAISEGLGLATGASGKVIHLERPHLLDEYRGLRVESLTVTPGLKTPASLDSLIRDEIAKAGANLRLTPDGTPGLLFTGEVINYESAELVDTAIGPLEECIVRARLTDAGSGRILAVANLISRAKSTTASGEKNLAAGVGKALAAWLDSAGIKPEEEKVD